MKKRYYLLDGIRGITIVHMILYHAMYDLVFLFGVEVGWYKGLAGYIWQQYICWSFIFLSGMCWSLGKNHWRRGIFIFLVGALFTVITGVFMPSERIWFGILSFMGTAMLLFIFLAPYLEKIPSIFGFMVSSLFFLVFKNINQGYLGFFSLRLVNLPKAWYSVRGFSFLGFPSPDFYSSDYFPLLPWIFLYGAGFYFFKWIEKKEEVLKILSKKIRFFKSIGKYSIWIYIVHQPLILGIFLVWNNIFGIN